MRCILLLTMLLITLAACTNSTTQETPTLATEAPAAAEWPENFNFCRHNLDDPTGPSDCWSLQNAQEWLELGPEIGDVIWIWPENMPPPPLPEGLVWSRERDSSTGESFWLIVEA